MNTLLVVEDEKLIRQGIVAMIRRSSVPVEEILECRNGEEALEILRKQYVEYLQDVVEDDEGMTPEEYEERLRIVKQIISELPPRTRFVLEQCYFNNKKYQEVAEILDVTSSAVKKHIMKALSILRERLSVIKS